MSLTYFRARGTRFPANWMILPQLEEHAHGVDVVGMFFFEDNRSGLKNRGCNATPSIFETASNYVLVQGDPLGERLALVARRTNRLLMGCDQCCYEREIHNKLVAGATIGCFPNLYAGLSQNRPDQFITL